MKRSINYAEGIATLTLSDIELSMLDGAGFVYNRFFRSVQKKAIADLSCPAEGPVYEAHHPAAGFGNSETEFAFPFETG